MKKIVKYIISIIMINSLIGCGDDYIEEYTEDYSEKYTEYFTYAFEEYEVTKGQSFHHPTRGKVYETYRVSYISADNRIRSMYYSNVPGDLAMDIQSHAEERAKEITWENYFSNYLEDSYLDRIYSYNLYLRPFVYQEYDEKIIDYKSNNGIKFKDFDISTLSTYKFEMDIDFFYTLHTEEELEYFEDVRQTFINLFLYIYEESNNENLILSMHCFINGRSIEAVKYKFSYDKINKQVLFEETIY